MDLGLYTWKPQKISVKTYAKSNNVLFFVCLQAMFLASFCYFFYHGCHFFIFPLFPMSFSHVISIICDICENNICMFYYFEDIVNGKSVKFILNHPVYVIIYLQWMCLDKMKHFYTRDDNISLRKWELWFSFDIQGFKKKPF